MKKVVLFTFFFLLGCSTKDKKQVQKPVDSDKKEATALLRLPKMGENMLTTSEFADTVLYIPLETNSQSLFKKISQIQLINDNILISSTHRLLLFTKKGKFIRQIGKKGKGPGEYLLIFDFVAISDTIFISSSGKRSLI
ncbi:MAG: 6-bladed beta-propeller, partial [Cytophagales bacterium]|nr:6-bladed beta-propeller [Cytophagales bacterium]